MPKQQGFHRLLRPNEASYLPRYLISFDAETLPTQTDKEGKKFSHRFRLATATRGRIVGTEATGVQNFRFTSKLEFWEWLKTHTAANYTTWIIGHNIIFDIIVCGIGERLESADLVVDWPRSKRGKPEESKAPTSRLATCVLESPPTILACRCSSTGARMVFLDTLNWFPVPLAVLGESCGLPKLQFPEWKDSDETWFEYCQRDSDICFQSFVSLIKWVRENDFGVFRYTAPSQAMSAFRHKFMRHSIYLHDNMEVKRLERGSYFGGRTEVFRKGEIRQLVHQLDVNSLFPSVMESGLFPTVLDRYHLSQEYTDDIPKIDWRSAVASVILNTSDAIYPLRTDNCVIYPSGNFAAILCGRELEHAYKSGHILGVSSWAEYRLLPLFNYWVGSLYGMRLRYKSEGNLLYDEFTKRLLNSLYGKFGERSPAWQNCEQNKAGLPWMTWTEIDKTTGKATEYRMVGWQCQKRVEGEETSRSFVAIAAFVTAAARVRMNNLRQIAGSANVYYQGVDGLIVTTEGMGNLAAAGEIHNTALGKMRLVMSCDSGEIIGCSDYRLGDKVIIAGRSRSVAAFENGATLQRKFYTSRDLFNGKSITEVAEELLEWKRRGGVKKGEIGDDGWIKPFELTMTPKTSEYI